MCGWISSLLIPVVFPGGDLLICSSASSQKTEAEQILFRWKLEKGEINRTWSIFSLVSCCIDKMADKESENSNL